MKGNAPDKVIAGFRDEWVKPLKEIIEELEIETHKYKRTDRLIERVLEQPQPMRRKAKGATI